MDLSILMLCGLWFWVNTKRFYKIIKDPLILPVMVMVIVFALFYLFSSNRPVAFGQWQRILFSGLAFFAAYRVFPVKYRKNLIDVLIITGGLAGLYGILQKSGGIGRIDVPKMSRVFSTFGNPNFFASFLIGLIPLSLMSFFKDKRKWKLIFLAMMLIALYHTGTRGAWLGLAGAGILGSLCVSKKREIILVFLIIVILMFGWFTRSKWKRGTERLMIWRDTLKMAVSNPVIGVGLGKFYSEFPEYASDDLLKILPQGKFIVNYAHNEFLELLAETGLAGVGVYIWFLVVFYIRGLKKQKLKLINTGAMFGATAILIHSCVSVNMRFAVSSIWAFMLMGMTFSSEKDDLDGTRPVGLGSLLLAGAVFLLLFYSGKVVVDPLVSQKKLAKEVDFFDMTAEYDKGSLEKKIKNDTKDADIYYKLGWEQAKKKDFANAIKNFEKVIVIDPGKVGAYNNLGNIYYTMGKRDLAEKYYIQALNINPGLTDAHFNLGYIYYYQGRLQEATREFKIVLKQEPDNYKAKIMLEKMVQ